MSKNDSLLGNLEIPSLYTRYSSILTLSEIPLFIFDKKGTILLEFFPSPDFCIHYCQKKANQACGDYVTRAQEGTSGRFTCQYGLENILLPIRNGTEIIGHVGGMQVYTPETEYEKIMIQVATLAEANQTEPECIARAITSLRTVEPNKIQIHEQLCSHISNNISLDLSESKNLAKSDVARLSIEKEILEKKIIDLEAKNMSLVINPHFLFNTLNCIARIAYFEKAHTIEELIYCLSDLLRYNLKQDNQLHTIASEIDNIEKYLYIQKVRFKNRLEYEIHIPDELKNRRIPNMVIQPIVENALIHGITPKRDGGKIIIVAQKDSCGITISVTDNGNGFPAHVLENLENSESKSGLGYKATDRRLKQHYGEEAGLSITKSDFSGSTVSIMLPTNQQGRCAVCT